MIDVIAFEQKQEEKRMLRDIAIFTGVLQGMTYKDAAQKMGVEASLAMRVIGELLKGIFEELKEKGESDAHPFTVEKYPHLYAKVQGVSTLALYLVKRKELMAEKDFLINKLHPGLKRPEKKRFFGATLLDNEYAQQQRLPLNVVKSLRARGDRSPGR